MTGILTLGRPLDGIDARAKHALWDVHVAMDDNADSADHLLRQVHIGPDGEGQDFAAELEAIRDTSRMASRVILALLMPEVFE